MRIVQQFLWKVTWHPKGADPEMGSVKTCVSAESLSDAVSMVMEHYKKDGESYCVITQAEMVGEWLLT